MSSIKAISPTGPLAERSPNTISPTKSKAPGKLASTDERTIMPKFEQAPQQTTNGASQTYISPSDAIRSPTTQKLSEIKGKRFMNTKPKTLFAQTVARQNLMAQSQAQDAEVEQK